MRLALFEPDIPQNTGALLRLAACLGVAVDLIEPCGSCSMIGGSSAPYSTMRLISLSAVMFRGRRSSHTGHRNRG